MSRQRIFPRGTGWRRVLLVSLTAGVAVTGMAALLGLLLDGGAAAASALGGGAAVVVLSGVTLLLIDVAERRAPTLTITVFLLGFVVKLGLLAVMLASFPAPDWVMPAWAALTAAAVVIVWQAAEVIAFMGMRVTVDP